MRNLQLFATSLNVRGALFEGMGFKLENVLSATALFADRSAPSGTESEIFGKLKLKLATLMAFRLCRPA